MRVLLLDRSNPIILQWVRGLAPAVADLGIKLVFFSDREPSRSEANLEIINIRDIPQSLDIETLQDQLDFSVYRALVPERAFTDYSSLRRCQAYSKFNLEQLAHTATPYLNALDYLVREKADLVLEGLVDNFMTSLVGRIAGAYGKPFYMAYSLYWWSDGLIFMNRVDQTSSQVEDRYVYLRAHAAEIDMPQKG